MNINNRMVRVFLLMALLLSACARNGVPSNTSNQSMNTVADVKPSIVKSVDRTPPVFANGVTVKKSVNENQISAITLNASDETSTVSYSIVGGDSASFNIDSKTGIVTFVTAPDYEATPTKNSYVFAAIAKDAALNESSQAVMINVLDVDEVIPNKAPVANAGKNQSVKKSSKVTLDASLSSDDGSIKKYVWSEGTRKLSTKKSFKISTLSVGTHKITLQVTDDKGATSKDTVLITVKGPLNQMPIALKQSLKVVEHQKLSIILRGTDADADELTYIIVKKPSHGTISGKVPRLKYIPAKKYSGEDMFTFTVSDGKATSPEATININVMADKTKGIRKNGVIYNTVKSPYTGKLWLDRNLGASQICSALNDVACYGNYYQWGRNGDGHQKSNSSKTRKRAKNINKAGTKFIKTTKDWSDVDHKGKKRALNWSMTDGSSICPTGYRVPTSAELVAETSGASSAVGNNKDAFKNFLKLPSAGYRYAYSGEKDYQTSYGFVWTSSAIGSTQANNLQLDAYGAGLKESYRGYAFSVRCVKD